MMSLTIEWVCKCFCGPDRVGYLYLTVESHSKYGWMDKYLQNVNILGQFAVPAIFYMH